MPQALRAAESLNGWALPPGQRVRPRRPEVGCVRVVGLEPADHAPVGHGFPLGVEVVHRVVRPVRVRRREDEDVEVVDELPRPLVDRVVAEQLLGRLEAGQRRRPLAGVLLAVEKHADLGAVPLLADPHHRVLERPARDVGVRGGGEEVGQVALRPRLRDPRARVPAVGLGDELRGRTRVRVDRRRHLGGGAGERARRVGGEADTKVVACQRHRERRVGEARVDELGREVVPALVAPGPRREDDRLGRSGAPEVPGGRRARQAGHQRLCPPLVAVRLVRQRDHLGEVRELRRELAEARVDLGRVHVTRREVGHELLLHRRQAAAEPDVCTGASMDAPVLEPIRIIVGRGGSGLPASPIRTSSRCSM